jgi:hypothetical protein
MTESTTFNKVAVAVNETVWHAEILSVRCQQARVARTADDRIDTAISTSLAARPSVARLPVNESRHDQRHRLVTGQLAAAHRRDELPGERVYLMAGKPHRRRGDGSRLLRSIVHISMMPRDARSSPRSRHLPRECLQPGCPRAVRPVRSRLHVDRIRFGAGYRGVKRSDMRRHVAAVRRWPISSQAHSQGEWPKLSPGGGSLNRARMYSSLYVRPAA